MRIVKSGYEILTEISPFGQYELMDIERTARTCYRSEDKILDQAESAKKLVANLIKSGHEAMLEHGDISVKFTCDRAIANELVRHRMASFAQESTRYCNYSKDKFGNEIEVIEPPFTTSTARDDWAWAMRTCETSYFRALNAGEKPEIARAALPLSLATHIVVKADYREWRHIDLKERLPIIFDDIEVEDIKDWKVV